MPIVGDAAGADGGDPASDLGLLECSERYVAHGRLKGQQQHEAAATGPGFQVEASKNEVMGPGTGGGEGRAAAEGAVVKWRRDDQERQKLRMLLVRLLSRRAAAYAELSQLELATEDLKEALR
jgi:hypothetical protein